MRTFSELSEANLLHNLSVIKNLAPKSKIIAMVKANAYGHGIRSVSKKIEKHVDLLGVASVEEALALRQCGIKGDIILMQGILEEGQLKKVHEHSLHLVLHNHEQLSWLKKFAASKELNMWIKVNTGMGRLGFEPYELDRVYEEVSRLSALPVKIMSHFACADNLEHELNSKQINIFNDITKGKNAELSFCNSAGIINFPSCAFDYVRPGIMLYGISPIKGVTGEELGLRPVMSLYTKITSIKSYKKGSHIGYGGEYQCSEDCVIGIASCGYGDGYPILKSPKTYVYVNGVACPVVGRVSMDMLAFDLSNCDAKIGDTVVLWGQELPVEILAKCSDTYSYNLITGVQNRVQFFWK